MSDNYEAEQAELKEKVEKLKGSIDYAKSKMDEISKFISLVEKYSYYEELTPEILRAFIDKALIYEKAES